MSLEAMVISLAMLVAGLLIGWLLGGRQVATLKVHAEQSELHRSMLSEVTKERDQALRAHAEHRAGSDAREAAFQARLDEMAAAREALSAQFSTVGAELLETAQRKFLERADERFKQSEETAGQGLRALLQPVNDRLERYEEGVAKVEAERRNAFGNLEALIGTMRIGQEKVSSEAAKLVNSLRNAPKSRGRWGEQQLKNVLETCGLSEHTDFSTEVNVTDGDGKRMRPDAILRVPGGKALVIDAKVSLNAYQDAFNAVDESERALGLKRHALAMKGHVNGLSEKAYWDQFDDAPDYVIMFVPGEHFLTAAMEYDSELWEYAFKKRVILATPANLVAIARTVSAVWRQETLAKEARQIGVLGKELYDRLAIVSEDLAKAGGSLNKAVSHFNSATGSFNRNLTSTGKKFRSLNIETGKRELEDLAPIEALVSHATDEHATAVIGALSGPQIGARKLS